MPQQQRSNRFRRRLVERSWQWPQFRSAFSLSPLQAQTTCAIFVAWDVTVSQSEPLFYE
jgi:hypothetical protein